MNVKRGEDSLIFILHLFTPSVLSIDQRGLLEPALKLGVMDMSLPPSSNPWPLRQLYPWLLQRCGAGPEPCAGG